MMRCAFPIVVASLLPVAACGSDTALEPGCELDDERVCACANGSEGSQTCAADGTYGACACEPTTGSSCTTAGVIHFDGVVNDADYDGVGDTIVVGTSTPPALNVIDPATGDVIAVDTTFSPTRVSVSPDGSHVVNGHDGRMSIVDLVTLQAATPIELGVKVSDVVASDGGYAYVWSHDPSNLGEAFSIAVDGGQVIDWAYGGIMSGARSVLHPSGAAIFSIQQTFAVHRYDITAGPLANQTDETIDQYPFCGDLWINAAGDRAVSNCGHVHALTPAGTAGYLGSLIGADVGTQPAHPRVVSAWHAAAANQIAILLHPEDTFLPDDAPPDPHRWVDVFDATSFALLDSLDLPCVHDEPAEDATLCPASCSAAPAATPSTS